MHAEHPLCDADEPTKLANWSGFTDRSHIRSDLWLEPINQDFSGYSPGYRVLSVFTVWRPMW